MTTVIEIKRTSVSEAANVDFDDEKKGLKLGFGDEEVANSLSAESIFSESRRLKTFFSLYIGKNIY